MKTITMDFDVYEDELNKRYLIGKQTGIHLTARFITSNLSLEQFLETEQYLCGSELEKNLQEDSSWGTLAKCLGRPLKNNDAEF